MSSISDLELLIEQLNEVAPPPKIPLGVNQIIKDSGEWRLVKVGAGLYAVRGIYRNARGEEVECRQENEIVGFAPAVTTAVRFTLSILSSSRHYWITV
jgi:hypothetical protein